MDLSDFLLARIAEQEDQLRQWWDDGGVPLPEGGHLDLTLMLAECEAKRRIVQEWSGLPLVQARLMGAVSAMQVLALPYADHPDYRQEWKP